MTQGGKKYNIWIAYSDLFTNLSTFLFISALGVFAAFGSGSFATMGLGALDSCSVPAKAETSLKGRASIVTDLPAIGQPAECQRYYGLGSYRFRYSDFYLSSLRDDDRATLSEADVLSRICEPIWLLVSRRDFIRHDGRLTLRGIAGLDNEWRYQPTCPNRTQDTPSQDRWRIYSYDLIAGCERRPGPHQGPCRVVMDCLRRPVNDRNPRCEWIVAARERGERASLACHEQHVRQQAATLYRICESAPLHDSFESQRFNDPAVFVDAARRDDLRGALWERVEYGAYIKRGASPQQSPLNSREVGSVVLHVRYGR